MRFFDKKKKTRYCYHNLGKLIDFREFITLSNFTSNSNIFFQLDKDAYWFGMV